MDSFEFLGGRYTRPEQIMSGPVQAFRAQNAASGRSVFIHRVSTTEAAAEQASLLKLMTTALVKSADAKRLVLDFGEERGYWYVVTESEPQCALLREWLQLEIDAAGSQPQAGGSAPPAATPPVSRPSRVPQPEQTDAGEFTRFLQARPPATNSPSVSSFVPRPFTPQPVRPVAPPPLPPPAPPIAAESKPLPPIPTAGEFTSLFNGLNVPPVPKQETGTPEPKSLEPKPTEPKLAPPAVPMPPRPAPPPSQPSVQRPDPTGFTRAFNNLDPDRKRSFPANPVAPKAPQSPPPPQGNLPQEGPVEAEPGEFTRFFKPGGLPSPAPKGPAANPFAANIERTQSPFVQRPNKTVNVPPAAPKPADPGEFTQMFSRPDKAKAPVAPAGTFQPSGRSDPLGFAKHSTGQPADLSEDLFNDRLDAPKPMPSSQPQQSEFTRMFGSKGAASPPVPPQAVVAQPREKPLLDEDPMKLTQAMPTPHQPGAPSAGEQASPDSASEFTRIMQGGYGPAKPTAGASGAPAAGGPGPKAGGSGSPLLNVNLSAANPAALLPHLGSAAGSMGGVSGHANSGGASANSPLGHASMQGPHIPGAQMRIPSANIKVPPPSIKGANKKMVILFAVIGVLAVLLIMLMLFLMKNK